MVGIPGSGKSFFAEHFADTFKAPIISHNRLRTELFKSPTFNKSEDEIISRISDYMLDEVLKTERTVVYDGKSDLRISRDLIAKKAKSFGYEPLFVWAQTDIATAKKRATKKTTDKPVISTEQFDIILKQFSAPHRIENTIVISGKHTYSSQLKIVLKYLADPRKNTESRMTLVN
jgi:predicted kinase